MKTSKLLSIIALGCAILSLGQPFFPSAAYFLPIAVLLICIAHLMNEP